MNLQEYIKKLEAAQAALPEMLADAARNATLRAVEAAQDKTPPTADSLSGTNTRTGELKQRWATDSRTEPYGLLGGELVTNLSNNANYASYVNDGHWTNPKGVQYRFVPGYWLDDGRFIYDPSAEGGMVLKQHWVEGKHYWESALRILDKMMPDLLDAKLQTWLDEYFE